MEPSDDFLFVDFSINVVVFLSSTKEIQIWHLSLGRLPCSQLKTVFPNLPIKDCIDTNIYQIYHAAKQTRLSSPTSFIKTTKSIKLLHINLWGPYKTKSMSGCNQFVTIVDDFTRFTSIHLLKFRSDVGPILKSFLQFIENQFKTSVLSSRTDNALDLSAGFFFLKKEILH